MPLAKKQSINNDKWLNAIENIEEFISKNELDKLVKETVKEIKTVTKGQKVAYAWSAGKDSIVLGHICEKAGINYKVGNIFSSDTFYDDANSGMQWAKMGVLGVEMESAALYCNAARAGKKALCICTVSDSFIYPEENTTAEERQNSFTKMMEIALELA